MSPKALCFLSATVGALCALMIVLEFAMGHPRIWLIAVNALAVGLNGWTFITNLRLLRRRRELTERGFI